MAAAHQDIQSRPKALFEAKCFTVIVSTLHKLLTEKANKDVSLKQLLESGFDKMQIKNHFIEAINVVSSILSVSDNQESFQNLSGLLYDAHQLNFISKAEAQTYVEPQLLIEAGMIDTDSTLSFEKRVKRINTALYFKQRKFNLLSESYFGFSSLLAFLSTALKYSYDIDKVRTGILYSIGRFDLDPNRVLFIIFDFICLFGESEVFVSVVLELFSKHTILNFIAFYLNSSFSKDSRECCFLFVEGVLSRSLDDQIKENLLLLQQTWSPNQNKISLVALIPILLDKNAFEFVEIANLLSFRRENFVKYLKIEASLLTFKRMRSSILSKPDMSDLFDFAIERLRENNHLLSLIAAMVELGKLEEALSLIETLSKLYESELSFFDLKRVIEALNTLLISALEESLEAALEILTYLKYNMNLANFQKFVTTLRSSPMENSALFALLRDVVIPTQAVLSDMEDSIEESVFQVIKENFSLSERYSLYEECFNGFRGTEDKHFKSFVDKNLEETKQILKKTSSKKAVMIAAAQKLKKVMSRDCLTCIQYLLKNIQIYDNLSKVFVSTLSVCSTFNFDVISYLFIKNVSLIVEEFNSSKDLALVYSKFEALGKFIGFFYKKFYDVEIEGLLNYIVDSLSKGMISIVVIVEQIFEKMGSQRILDNISIESLASLSGSPLLRKLYKVSREEELTTYLEHSSSRRNKRVHYLKKVLLEKKFALPLLVNLLILRKRVVVDKDYHDLYKDPTLMSTNVDKITQVFLQVVEFLRAELSQEEYFKLFEDFDLIALDFHIDFSLFFHVVRPMIQSVYKTEQTCPETDKAKWQQNKWFVFSSNLKNIYTKLKTNASMIQVRGSMPQYSDSTIKLELLFHSFSLYFVKEPSEAYQNEIKKIEDFLEKRKQYNLNNREIEKLNATKASLMKDKADHAVALDGFLGFVARMQRQESTAVVLTRADKYSEVEESVWEFLGRLILSRCLISPECAVYSSAFLALSTRLVPGCCFNIILLCLPEVLLKLYCCTEREAKNIAMFLKLFLSSAAKKMIEGKSLKYTNVKHAGEEDNVLEGDPELYEQEVKNTFSKFTKIISEALSSEKTNLVRATLIVGTAITDHFPSDVTDATKLKIMVSKVLKQRKPQTMLMAKGYLALLEQRFKLRELQGVSAAKKQSKEISDVVEVVSVESGEIEKNPSKASKSSSEPSEQRMKGGRKRKKEESESKPEKKPRVQRDHPERVGAQRTNRSRTSRQNSKERRERGNQSRREEHSRRGRHHQNGHFPRQQHRYQRGGSRR